MRVVRGVFWWGVTLITLFIVDDLLFGPLFWIISLAHPLVSTVAAFVASLVFQNWLTKAALKEQPSKRATFFLQRLMLERKNKEIAQREDSLKRRASSTIGALLVTPFIGAIIPTLLLHKYHLMPPERLRSFSALLRVIYAVEFALLHGGYGFGRIFRALF